MSSNVTSYIVCLVLAVGGSVLSPQVKKIPLKGEQVNKIDTTYHQELSKLKDSIISCVNAAEKSKQVISLNEQYIKKLDQKITKQEKFNEEK